MKQIMLSQLIGLISATWETKKIIAHASILSWDDLFDYKGLPKDGGTYDLKNRPLLYLRWSNNIHCGQKEQEIGISFNKAVVPDARMAVRNPEAHGHVFYYHGDNCNDYTMFLYSFMGNETDIIDDLGIIGYPKRHPGRKSVCGMSAHQYRSDVVNKRDPSYNELIQKTNCGR